MSICSVKALLVAAVVFITLPTAIHAQQGGLPFELKRPFTRAMFGDKDHGYVFDDRGTRAAVVATDDGGATWRLVFDAGRPGATDDLGDVFVLDLEQLWVLTRGGRLYRTADGGHTFELFTPTLWIPATGKRMKLCGPLFFRTATEGWSTCAGVSKSADGGATWVRIGAGRREGPARLWMFDGKEGIGTGDRDILRTTDGWQTQTVVPSSPALRDLTCRASGFCVGLGSQYGPVFVSRDRGQTWVDTDIPLKPGREDEIHEIQAFAVNAVVAVGSDAGFNVVRDLDTYARGTPAPAEQGLILKWDGSNWTRIVHAEPRNLLGAYFVDANNGWLLAGDNGIYKTTDGGQTVTFVPDYFRQIAARTPSPTPFMLGPTPTP